MKYSLGEGKLIGRIVEHHPEHPRTILLEIIALRIRWDDFKIKKQFQKKIGIIWQ